MIFGFFVKRLGLVAILSATWLGSTLSAAAEDLAPPLPSAPPPTHRTALGFNVDLFPIVASAAQGKFGFSGQLQYAIDHVQLRYVGARMRQPDFIIDADNFKHLDTTVLALLIDYFWRDDLSGFWVCSGFELWLNEISHNNTSQRASWNNAIWTMGGGYVWKFYKNFFLNPWLGLHLRLNNPGIELAGARYRPMAVLANGSIKIGFTFEL